MRSRTSPARRITAYHRPPNPRVDQRVLPVSPPSGRALARVVLVAALALCAAPLEAQEGSGWDAPRVLEIVQRAQERRLETESDRELLNYQADARGHVYFYLDRQDTGTRNLIKTDQLALEVFWHAPDMVKQRIVGWRDAQTLPSRIHYHLDHLSVVQENFGPVIRIGDGDEVSDVVHPAAAGARELYEYLLADSLTLRLPGAEEPVRVFEIRVRPRDPSQPGIVGTIFVERRAGDLVRMDFTFTRASYVDRYLDGIRISLDNGLWMGRYWLPNRQDVEIRRQLPQLDIPAGTVIRGTMQVGNYRFNQDLPLSMFRGPAVVAAPRGQLATFPFEEEIFAALEAEGLGPETELGEIRAEAQQLLRDEILSGLPPVRWRLGAASEVLRYNRAEGLSGAVGFSVMHSPWLRAAGRLGWASGPGHPRGELELRWSRVPVAASLRGFVNDLADVGPFRAGSGALNSLQALVAGRDHSDPFYRSGVEGELSGRLASGRRWRLTGELSRHGVAELSSDFGLFAPPSSFRAVHAVDRGTMHAAGGELRQQMVEGAARRGGGALRLRGGVLTPDAGEGALFATALAELEAGRSWERRELETRLRAGVAGGEMPVQELFLLGGRGTLPGHVFRDLGGDRFILGEVTLSVPLGEPALRGRVSGAAGWMGAGAPSAGALSRWPSTTTGARGSLGVGLGIFYDILRVDLARGIGDGGRWELIVETRRPFWDFL
jgi:hypothetical protein